MSQGDTGRTSRQLSRRMLLRGFAVSSAAAAISAACGGTAPQSQATATTSAATAPPSPVSIKFAHLYAETHFGHIAVVRLKEMLAERSGGAIKLDIFPGGMLGNEAQLLEQVRAGAIQFMAGGGSIQKFVPELGVTHLPALYRDYAHFNKVVATPNGPLEQLNKIALDKNVGVRIFGWSPNGFRNFMHRSKQIRATVDFRGVKIRVDDVPTSAKIWAAQSANPLPMAFNEIYSALQTGVIDAAEGAFANMLSQKFYEQAKFITLTGHQLALDAFIGNADWFAGLAPATQTTITQAFTDFVQFRTGLAEKADKDGADQLTRAGATVVALSDPEVFRSNLLPLQKEFGEQYKQMGIIEAIANIK